jgi:L-seryl-tRNA(Ser) seleniumtransferase
MTTVETPGSPDRNDAPTPRLRPPALDRLLERAALQVLVAEYGRAQVVAVAQAALQAWRDHPHQRFELTAFDHHCGETLARAAVPSLRRVFNLTGTMLHTNLGRAPMAAQAQQAVMAVMGGASNLEFDLATGKRGDRDDHVEALLRELTGAQAATVVNNNAAAVLLVIAALSQGREALVSRGELVEIGGAFRVPDIMRRAQARLVEVGTTNRTHLSDFADAITARTGLVMKVHTSNYVIQGFTASVPPAELAALCRSNGVPFMEDLGSGALVDLARYGLPREPLPQESIRAGVNVVTFSGDKLLGGPQAGLIVGDAALIAKIKRHPLKRALRVDKMTIAALEATLRLYRNPDRLAHDLPALQLLTRPTHDLKNQAERLAAALAPALGAAWRVQVEPCKSQIGSGSLPVDLLESYAVTVAAASAKPRGTGKAIEALAARARAMRVPIIGRVEQQRWWLDVRGLMPADEAEWLAGWFSD